MTGEQLASFGAILILFSGFFFLLKTREALMGYRFEVFREKTNAMMAQNSPQKTTR